MESALGDSRSTLYDLVHPTGPSWRPGSRRWRSGTRVRGVSDGRVSAAGCGSLHRRVRVIVVKWCYEEVRGREIGKSVRCSEEGQLVTRPPRAARDLRESSARGT